MTVANGNSCVSPAECAHQQLVCQAERLKSAQESERRLSKIEQTLQRIEEKLDELVELTPRVASLEAWKQKLNGKAEALVEYEKNHPKPVEIHALEPPHRGNDTDDGDHRPERTSSEVVIQMTAKTLKLILLAIAASLFVLIGLALVAGEKGWVVLTKTEEAAQHSHAAVQKSERNYELLKHMHDFHGGPDPDVNMDPKLWRP